MDSFALDTGNGDYIRDRNACLSFRGLEFAGIFCLCCVIPHYNFTSYLGSKRGETNVGFVSTKERDRRIFRVSKVVPRGYKCLGIVLCVFGLPKDIESLPSSSSSSAEQAC